MIQITRSDNKMSKKLTDRKAHLLKVLIETYIEHGQPVGSKTLAEVSDIALKPASIRNIMAELEEQGFLTSPHTSAGRIPTSTGYRFFVDSLLKVDCLDPNQQHSIVDALANEPDHQLAIQKASSLLSAITNMASVIMVPTLSSPILRHVEFLTISANRILVILVVNEQEVQNKVIAVEKPIQQTELEKIANYINGKYSGYSLDEIIKLLRQDMRHVQDEMNHLMNMAIEMTTNVINEQNQEDIVIRGETSLMDVAELNNLDKLKNLFEGFHQKHNMLRIFEHCLHHDGVQIFIGKESGYDVFDDCSMITSPYYFGENDIGVLGVIGPKRMQYGKVIPVVEVTSQILSSALKSQDLTL